MGLAGVAQVLRGCDVAFPLVHGPRGEDGTLAALCELAGLRYVGSGVGAGALAMDKWATKLVARRSASPPRPRGSSPPRPRTSSAWTLPVVVKPVAAGSSRGRDPGARGRRARPGARGRARARRPRALVEDVVVGREIDVAVLRRADGSLLRRPALEIVVDGLFDYDAKYGGRADFRVPAALDDRDAKALQDAAVAMYDALGCSGVARVDFFLTDDGPVLNEVNTTPGHDRALAGAADVRRRRTSPTPTSSTSWSAAPTVTVAVAARPGVADRLGVVRLRRHALTHLAGGPASPRRGLAGTWLPDRSWQRWVPTSRRARRAGARDRGDQP